MRNFPIMVFDSGIGGLGVLREIEKVLPNQNFVYIADFLHSPYGNKTKAEIKEIVLDVLKKYVKKFKPKCLVIACNTATAVCINDVRKMFQGIFVVGCEPAIKLAKKEGKKRILILCTMATKKYCSYLKSFDDIKIFSPKKLATLVDQNYLKKEKITRYLNRSLKKFCGEFDAVVLGCTHYSLLKNEIENILQTQAFDGNFAIAKYVKIKIGDAAKRGKTKLISTIKKRQRFLIYCYKKIKGEKICAE